MLQEIEKAAPLAAPTDGDALGAEWIGSWEALTAHRNALGKFDLGTPAVPCFHQILYNAGLMGSVSLHDNEGPQQFHAVLMVLDNF